MSNYDSKNLVTPGQRFDYALRYRGFSDRKAFADFVREPAWRIEALFDGKSFPSSDAFRFAGRLDIFSKWLLDGKGRMEITPQDVWYNR
jgi:hypothetical protein